MIVRSELFRLMGEIDKAIEIAEKISPSAVEPLLAAFQMVSDDYRSPVSQRIRGITAHLFDGEVRTHILNGQKIAAIKALRVAFADAGYGDLNLLDAKNAVEDAMERYG